MGKEGSRKVLGAVGANRLPIGRDNGTQNHQRSADLQRQRDRSKSRRFLSPRELCIPRAPRNTSCFIMSGKKVRALPSLVSPVSPPAALQPIPLPRAAPYKEGLDEEVDKEWGVDSYGSMSGLIRLRSVDDGTREAGYGDTGETHYGLEQLQFSHAVKSVQQLEQRIDQRFEIVCPSWRGWDSRCTTCV